MHHRTEQRTDLPLDAPTHGHPDTGTLWEKVLGAGVILAVAIGCMTAAGQHPHHQDPPRAAPISATP
jgi:hypothetical protein